MSHVQENAEIGEEPKHNETESQKANISDGLLMAEKTGHKHSDDEFATTMSLEAPWLFLSLWPLLWILAMLPRSLSLPRDLSDLRIWTMIVSLGSYC
jgi:hypothetical protein